MNERFFHYGISRLPPRACTRQAAKYAEQADKIVPELLLDGQRQRRRLAGPHAAKSETVATVHAYVAIDPQSECALPLPADLPTLGRTTFSCATASTVRIRRS